VDGTTKSMAPLAFGGRPGTDTLLSLHWRYRPALAQCENIGTAPGGARFHAALGGRASFGGKSLVLGLAGRGHHEARNP